MRNKYSLPNIKGKYHYNISLKNISWLKVGGEAEVLFFPEDEDDLSYFLKHIDPKIEIHIIGFTSNLVIRDGGLSGVTIKLNNNFKYTEIITPNKEINTNDVNTKMLLAGAGSSGLEVSNFACNKGYGGFEFLSGIPGSIGGMIYMNAGAFGSEISSILICARAVDFGGNIKVIKNSEMMYEYRKSNYSERIIFTAGIFKLVHNDIASIRKKMDEIFAQRTESQPKIRTAGSTFKNPRGVRKKAWELINDAGCRGLRVGGATMSELHCNFITTTSDATAKDIEDLVITVKDRVYRNSGILLEEEIVFLGNV